MPDMIITQTHTYIYIVVVDVLSILLKLLLAFPVPSLLFSNVLMAHWKAPVTSVPPPKRDDTKLNNRVIFLPWNYWVSESRIHSSTGREVEQETMCQSRCGWCGWSVGHKPTLYSLGPVFWDRTRGQCGTRERSWYCLGETGSVDRSIPLLPHLVILLQPTLAIK